jgi:hypothetical protein
MKGMLMFGFLLFFYYSYKNFVSKPRRFKAEIKTLNGACMLIAFNAFLLMTDINASYWLFDCISPPWGSRRIRRTNHMRHLSSFACAYKQLLPSLRRVSPPAV